MQKNYRDFTVGELLDMGLKVHVTSHSLNEENAWKIVRMFEGSHHSSSQITKDLRVIRGWKKNFELTCFL